MNLLCVWPWRGNVQKRADVLGEGGEGRGGGGGRGDGGRGAQ